MKTILNSALANASNAAKSIIFMMLSVFVFGICFTSCETGASGIDDVIVDKKPCPGCPTDSTGTNPEPDITVKDVYNLGCGIGAIDWRAENATFTKSLSLDNRDGGVFAKVQMIYKSNTEYSNGTGKNRETPYSIDNSVAAFGYKGVRFFKKSSIELFKKKPSIKENGDVTILTWENGKNVSFLSVSQKSVSSLTIDGKVKTDLCDNNIRYDFDRSEVIAEGDSADFMKYTVRIHGTATISEGQNNVKSFYIDMVCRDAKDGGIIVPDPDPTEIVKYDVINKQETSTGVTGDLISIDNNGKTTNIGKISLTLNRSTFFNEEQTYSVDALTYSSQASSFANNLRTGGTRSEMQLNCRIQITEMKNVITQRTNRAVCISGGLFEFPVLIDPLGGEHAWDVAGWTLNDNGITDSGINGNKMTISHKVGAKYDTRSESLASIVNLVKETTPDPDPDPTKQTGAYGKDPRIEGLWIKWTLVRTYNNKPNEETPMSILHKSVLAVEARKSTNSRNYGALTPAMNLVSSDSFTDDNYTGTFSKYTSSFIYAGFTNIISSETRTKVIYTDNGFKFTVWDFNALVEKTGVSLGTNSQNGLFVDNINYHLLNGGHEVATGVQEVGYTEPIKPEEDVVTETVEKTKVENGKIHYDFVVTHSKDTHLNSRSPFAVDIIRSLTATVVSPWETKLADAGFSLTGNTSHVFNGAKDYLYPSNRGENKAYAALQTSYVVTHNNKNYTLTITGSVNASVTKVSSTSTANTYSFTAKLLADNVEVASDSKNVVETIKADVMDEITRSVQKTGIRNGQVFYNYIVKHTVDTDKNTTTEHSVPVVANITATATADWTAKSDATGMTLTSSSQSYDAARNYIFGSNRGDNIANASLQKEYPVTHDGENFVITITGTVNASVNKASAGADANNYTFTAKVLADNVEVATASDIAVETVQTTPSLGIVAIFSTVVFDNNAVAKTAFACKYADGNCVIRISGAEVYRGPSVAGTISAIPNGNSWIPATISETASYVNYIGINGATSRVPMSEITYQKYPSGILQANYVVNSDGSWTISNNYGTETFGAY